MEAAKEEPVALKPRENLTTKIPQLDGPPMTIAVYGFQDKTGQMKPNEKLAVFSKPVTQGAEVFLIKSLQDSKNWFKWLGIFTFINFTLVADQLTLFDKII